MGEIAERDAVGGVGIVLGDLGDDLHLMGSDLDRCIANKELSSWAGEMIDRFNTYAEILRGEGSSVLSDLGARCGGRCRMMGGKVRKAFVVGEHREIALDRERYYAVTADCWGECKELRQVSVDDIRFLLDDAGPRFKQQYGAEADNPPSGTQRAGVGDRLHVPEVRPGERGTLICLVCNPNPMVGSTRIAAHRSHDGAQPLILGSQPLDLGVAGGDLLM